VKSFNDALRSAERASTLASDLDKVRSAGDLAQIASGLKLEIDRTIARLSEGLDALRAAAAGDREGKVRADARPTSQATASAITVKSGTQRAAVLLALAERPMTDREIQTRLAINQNSERPRRGELMDLGFVAARVADNGYGVTKSHDGTLWQVWEITAAGRVVAAALRRDGDSVADTATDAPDTLF
jgi:hypothetical protein